MRRKLRQGLLLVATTLVVGVLGGTTAKAETILPAGFDYWQYTTTNPIDNPTWTTGGGTFVTGAAPFGNAPYGGDTNNHFNWVTNGGTQWPINTNLWLRAQIDTNKPGFTLTSLNWFLGVDNGFTLFLNGTQVASNYAEGYTFRWEYSGTFANNLLSNDGYNWIAVALVDRGGYSAFDMQIEGSYVENPTVVAPEPVPVPAAAGLGFLGMAVIAGFRRRSSANAA